MFNYKVFKPIKTEYKKIYEDSLVIVEYDIEL